jgi:hypothetical protein
MAESSLPEEVIRAYQGARYRVESAGQAFILYLDRPTPELKSLLKRRPKSGACFLTAYNPYGKILSEEENHEAHLAFVEELKKSKLVFFEGVGEDPAGLWKSEPSFLVLGFSLEEAKAWGERLRQNAVVWAGADAVARLVLLR